MSSAEIDNIRQIWKESYIALQDVITENPVNDTAYSHAVPAIASIILLAFLFAFPILTNGFFSAAGAVFNTKKLLIIEDSAQIKTNREIALLFLIVLLSFIVSGGAVTLFFYFAAVTALFMLMRHCCFALLNWLHKTHIFKQLNGFYHSYFTVWCATALLGALIYFIVPSIGYRNIIIFTGATAVLSLFGFIVNGYQLIISNGFSHSFWILYLCTLEILPLIVFMHLIYA